jgi:hypothetical protein
MAIIKKTRASWRCMPIIPALEKVKHQNYEFKISLYYLVSSRSAWATEKYLVLKKKKKNKQKTNPKYVDKFIEEKRRSHTLLLGM